MSIVEIVRHAEKEGTRLSQEGRLHSFQKGQEYAEKYQYIDSMGSNHQYEAGVYEGRGVETAFLIGLGASPGKLYNSTVPSSPELVPRYKDEEYSRIVSRIKAGENILEAAIKEAPESLYENARQLACFIKAYAERDSDVMIGVTHSPSIEALAYLLTGDLEAVKGEPGFIEGITFDYDAESGLYHVTLDYANGETFEVEDLHKAIRSSNILKMNVVGVDSGEEDSDTEAGDSDE